MTYQKLIIRKKIAALKRSLPEETVIDLSGKITDRLVQTDLFLQAKCIALYYAIGNEVRTSELIEAWSGKKMIVLPVIEGENIHFYPYSGKANMKKGTFGIPEPVVDISKTHPYDLNGVMAGLTCNPLQDSLQTTGFYTDSDIDLFVVPGIAFDYDCNRLGRGKGYYDRFLSGVDKPVIGLCYDFQLFDSLPSETHDKKMTMVITEHATVSPHRQ